MKVCNLLRKNMWKITSGSLELIFYQEKLTMLKFEAFFSQITLCVSAVQVHQNCVYERGRLTSGLYNNGCACAKVYSLIFFLVRFYFLGHIFSKCKLGISLIKISLSTLCSANIENLTSFPFTSGSESIRITFLCFPLWKRKITEDISNDLKNGWKLSGIVHCWSTQTTRDSWRWCDKCHSKCR